MPENPGRKNHQKISLQPVKQGILLLMGMYSLFLKEGIGRFLAISEGSFSGLEKKNTARKQDTKT